MTTDRPAPTENKIAACVRIVARPGGADAMLYLLTRMAALAAQDDGTEIWAVHRGRKGTEEFFLYELFRDRDAFALHQANEGLNELGRELTETAAETVLTAGRLVAGVHPLL